VESELMRVLVKNAVKQAFAAIGSLAREIEFVQKESSAFNFSGANTVRAEVVTTIKCVDVETKRKKSDSPNAIATKSLLVIEEDVSSLDTYDSVRIDGVVWQIVHPIDQNGYTTTVEVVRQL
jgi:hypothetical protein